MQWIIEYRGLILAAIATALLLALTGAVGWARVRQALLGLMLRAEKAARRGDFGVISGPELMEIVIRQFMARVVPGLPPWLVWLKPFLTEDRVRAAAQFLYDRTLDWLDDGKFNNSVA